MTQINLPVMVSPTSGAQLVENLENWRDSLHSMHSGIVRPDYVLPQMMWIDTSTTPWVLKVFQGSDDIVLGMLNPSTLNFTPSNVDGGGVTGVLASNVTATNTNGLTSTNVQGQLDELSTLTGEKARVFTFRTPNLTSGSMAEITGIPDWARVVHFSWSLEKSGAATSVIQIGDAGGFDTSGYSAAFGYIDGSASSTASVDTGFTFNGAPAGSSYTGQLTLSYAQNIWFGEGISQRGSRVTMSSGRITRGVIDRIRMSVGSDNITAGYIQVVAIG